MAEVEWDEGRHCVVVTGLRFESSLEILALTLGRLVGQRRLEGVSEISNESTEGNTRLVVRLRPGANAQAVLDAVDEHMPSDDAEVYVDARQFDESDVSCPRCGTVVRRVGIDIYVSAVRRPEDPPDTYRSARILTGGGVAHECGD